MGMRAINSLRHCLPKQSIAHPYKSSVRAQESRIAV